MQDSATKFTDHRKVYAANTTSASITDPVPTITEPTGDGVVDLRLQQLVPNFGELIFFGAGSSNNAGIAKVYLWFKVGELWFPIPIMNLDLTLSTVVGVSGYIVTNTDRFVDTLAATSSSTNDASMVLLSPANDTIGKASFDIQGASKVEVRLAKGTATNLNSLFRGF